MKNFVVVLVALALLISCEAPQPEKIEAATYRGQTVVTGSAPFLVQNGLAKDSKDEVVISSSTAESTVYGLQDDEIVYLAVGGEKLPAGTWIGSIEEEPIEVSVPGGIRLTFVEPTTVTIIEADDMNYIDANGTVVVFSGSGVITTSEIWTGELGSVTLVTTVEFAIGTDGGDPA